MTALSDTLTAHWRSIGLSIAPGNSAEEIAHFEKRHKIRLAEDLRGYLLAVNGMLAIGPNDCDPNGFSFWPLERIKTVREESATHRSPLPQITQPDQYFVFADYLQWSWAYAIRLDSNQDLPNDVIFVGTQKQKQIAASFSEFVELYLRDAEELYKHHE